MGVVAALPSWLARRAITVDEYHRMAETGILTADDRVELIEGQIIQMAPIGSQHAGRVNRLVRLLVTALAGRAVVSVQNPVRLSAVLEPQPDIAILKPRQDDYADTLPVAEDVLLLIEVSDTSLEYDRDVKTALYARHGINEVWIVDVRSRSVTACRDPAGDTYRSEQTTGGTLTMSALPGVTLAVSDLFGS